MIPLTLGRNVQADLFRVFFFASTCMMLGARNTDLVRSDAVSFLRYRLTTT
jgi:hypothetical protein